MIEFVERVVRAYGNIHALLNSMSLQGRQRRSGAPFKFERIAELSFAYATGQVGLGDKVQGYCWASPFAYWCLPTSYSPFRLDTRYFRDGDKIAQHTSAAPALLPAGQVPYRRENMKLGFLYAHDSPGFSLELSQSSAPQIASPVISDPGDRSWLFNLDTGNANYDVRPERWGYNSGDADLAKLLPDFNDQRKLLLNDPRQVRQLVEVPDHCCPVPALFPEHSGASNEVVKVSGRLIELDAEILANLSQLGAPLAERVYSGFYRPETGLKPFCLMLDEVEPERPSKDKITDKVQSQRVVTLLVEFFFERIESGEPVSLTENEILDWFLPVVKSEMFAPRSLRPDRWLGKLWGFDGPIYVYKDGPLHVSISPIGAICVYTLADIAQGYALPFIHFKAFVETIQRRMENSYFLRTGKRVNRCNTFMTNSDWQLSLGPLLSGMAVNEICRRNQRLSSMQADLKQESKKSLKIKILFLAADPISRNQLDLAEEIREIREKLSSSLHRDLIEIHERWAVRPDDLLQAMNEVQPNIVHFSGHGNTSEEIILRQPDGTAKPVGKEALVQLFRILGSTVQIVVLNACFSQPQAEGIVTVVPCAVGMSKAIGDEAARIFASSFYRAIGFGSSVKNAFDQAVLALMLQDIPEHQTPQLLVQSGVDAGNLIITAEEL